MTSFETTSQDVERMLTGIEWALNGGANDKS